MQSLLEPVTVDIHYLLLERKEIMGKKKGIQIILTVALVVAMVAGSVAGSMAATTSQKAAQAKKEAADAGNKAKELYEQVDKAQDKIDSLQGQIDKTSADLAQTQKNLDAKKAEVDSQTNSLNNRLSAMYKTGSVGMIDVVLSSDNVSDLITNIAMVHKVLKHDQDLLSSLEDDYAEIQTLEKQQQQQQQQLANDKAKVEETKKSVASLADQYAKLEDEKNAQADQLAAQAEAERIAAEKKLAEMEAQRQQQQQQSNSGSSSSGSSAGGGSSSSGGSTGGSGYRWPLNIGMYSNITSLFGWRIHPIFGYRKYHDGVDIGVGSGTPVYAVGNGIVTRASWNGGYGNCVMISIGNGYTTLYGHLSGYAVSSGQYVSKGQVVGYVGSTGWSTGPHLHFSLIRYGTYINPYLLWGVNY